MVKSRICKLCPSRAFLTWQICLLTLFAKIYKILAKISECTVTFSIYKPGGNVWLSNVYLPGIAYDAAHIQLVIIKNVLKSKFHKNGQFLIKFILFLKQNMWSRMQQILFFCK